MSLARAPYAFFMHLFASHPRVLDFGCGSGSLLQEFAENIGEGVGVDLDERLIRDAIQKNSHSHVRFIWGDAKTGLPLPDGYFDVITAMGVLEHVGPEEPVLRELHRLLRPDGYLVIEVPARGPFQLLDIGNIKYRFPRFHRWYYIHVAHQARYYEDNFGAEASMFGQFARDANWHKHYSIDDLSGVASRWFRLERCVYHGLFCELIQLVEVIVTRPFGRNGSKCFGWLFRQDCRIVSRSMGANLVAIFQKTRYSES